MRICWNKIFSFFVIFIVAAIAPGKVHYPRIGEWRTHSCAIRARL